MLLGNCECVFKASRTLVTSKHLLGILPQVRSTSLSQGVKWPTPQAVIFWGSTQVFYTDYSLYKFKFLLNTLFHSNTILDRRISVHLSRSGYPSWILNRGGLASSGRILISSIGKSNIIFFYIFFCNKKMFPKFSIFFKMIIWNFQIIWKFFKFFDCSGFYDIFWTFWRFYKLISTFWDFCDFL